MVIYHLRTSSDSQKSSLDNTHLMVGKQGLLDSRRVVVLFSPRLAGPFRAGGHGEAEIPVPIPNTEVKRPIAEGSAGPARARVGRRRLFFCFYCMEYVTGCACAGAADML